MKDIYLSSPDPKLAETSYIEPPFLLTKDNAQSIYYNCSKSTADQTLLCVATGNKSFSRFRYSWAHDSIYTNVEKQKKMEDIRDKQQQQH